MSDFKIEGWFPPITYISHLTGVKYAICGSNWIEIPQEMTSEEVMAGWVCTAKVSLPKEIKKTIYPKRNTRTAIADMLSKETKVVPKVGMANMLSMIKKSNAKS